jgi:hypothetical protein
VTRTGANIINPTAVTLKRRVTWRGLVVSSLDTGCHAHWLPFCTVEGCFGARKQCFLLIFLLIKQKPVSFTSYRLVLDNSSVHGSQCPYMWVMGSCLARV